MARMILLTLTLISLAVVCQAAENAAPPKEQKEAGTPKTDGDSLKNQKSRACYCLGLNFGRSLRDMDIEIDTAALLSGLADVLLGRAPALTPTEMQETLGTLQKEMTDKQEARLRKLAEKNSKNGEAFLTENKKRDGVIVLPSGLQYRIVKEGTGDKPKVTDTVTMHYLGILLDGVAFDSSYARQEAVVMPVQGLIPGLVEALQLMKAGSKWQLFIPPELGYGDKGGVGGRVGPNATLVFEIELLSIAKEGDKAANKTSGKTN
jgi:FKBP-type peptidyl-prolyl cis-trans isomerase FklB